MAKPKSRHVDQAVTTMAIPDEIQRQIEAILTAKGLVRNGLVVPILPSSKTAEKSSAEQQRQAVCS